MNEINGVPFEFKIPDVPEITLENVIPTGKQIPRTPVKPEENNQVKEFHGVPVLSVPISKPLCSHKITQSTKNSIPKGKEIPRTPIPGHKAVGSSSSNTLPTKLGEADIGVQPLCTVDEEDDIDFKIEVNILKGKICVRKKCSKKKIAEEKPLPTSKESNQDCESSSNSLSKHTNHCKERGTKDSTVNLCKEMETKCALVERSPLKNISNGNSDNIRRNPDRRAKRRVNYKL